MTCAVIELHDDRFTTQIIYRDEDGDFVLGYIAEFPGQGVTRKNKLMYKGFVFSYKSSVDGVRWHRKWESRTGAIQNLLRHHGKDEMKGLYHIIPAPQMFPKSWM